MMIAKIHRTRIVTFPEIRRFLNPSAKNWATHVPAHLCIGTALFSQNENNKNPALRAGFLKEL